MEEPLGLKIDFKANAGYLRYRLLADGAHVTRTLRISDDVFVDYDDASRILGIEILALDSDAFGTAARFAEANNLCFPELLVRKTIASA